MNPGGDVSRSRSEPLLLTLGWLAAASRGPNACRLRSGAACGLLRALAQAMQPRGQPEAARSVAT